MVVLPKFAATLPQEQRPEAACQVGAKLLQNSFRHFVEAAWPVVDPNKLMPGWYLDAICEHMQALSEGINRRDVINCPPRLAKSTVANVLWPAWQWCRNGGRSRWLFCTCTEGVGCS